MGKIDYFTVVLEKPNAVYFSGEKVIGSLNYKVSERVKISMVRLTATGDTLVKWDESQGSGRGRRTRTYSSEEHYFKYETFFVNKLGSEDLYLEQGEYKQPFQITLPQNLPTSFEHSHGRVRYNFVGTIGIPWGIDVQTTKIFTVLSHIDLNNYPELRESSSISETKTFGCLFWQSQPVVATINLKKGGYVPGEAIVCDISIENHSSKTLKFPYINLVQKIKMSANNKYRHKTRKLTSVILRNKIAPRCQHDFADVSVVIPPTCASSLDSCRIIQISYTLEFKFGASGFWSYKTIEIPFVIGTMPIRDYSESMEERDGSSRFTLEASCFAANAAESSEQGEMMQSEIDKYKPCYPFYRNYSCSASNVDVNVVE